jgi:hypothetical protein
LSKSAKIVAITLIPVCPPSDMHKQWRLDEQDRPPRPDIVPVVQRHLRGCRGNDADDASTERSYRGGLRSRGPFLTSPLGVNFDTRGEVVPRRELCPLGVKFSLVVTFSVRPSILLSSRACSPQVVNERVNIPPRGQSSSLGTKLSPGGEFCPLDGGEVFPWRWNSLFAPPFY